MDDFAGKIDKMDARKGDRWLWYFYGLFVLFNVGLFVKHLYNTIINVDSMPAENADADRNTRSIDPRQTRKARLYLVSGMILGLILGAGAMYFWHVANLVRILPLEYATIIVPVQLVIGITAGSIFQAYTERDGQKPAGDRFERGRDGELTREGARQAMNFFVNIDDNQDSESFRRFARTLGVDVAVGEKGGVSYLNKDHIEKGDTEAETTEKGLTEKLKTPSASCLV